MGCPSAEDEISSAHAELAQQASTASTKGAANVESFDYGSSDVGSTTSTQSGRPHSESGSTDELDVVERTAELETEVIAVKLIFLDMDGPLCPWVRGSPYAWTAEVNVDEEPYVNHLNALQRIIDAAGGPEIVKVVISSNWRTDHEKYPWLAKQLKAHGIDVVGHTDVMHVHPSVGGESLRRNLELERALRLGSFGSDGPLKHENGSLSFTGLTLPSNWKISSWIAIDDLPLDKVQPAHWKNISYLCCFISSPEDKMVGNGWMAPPAGFLAIMQAWSEEFQKSHFVRVNPDAGIAGSPNAERRAIELLGAATQA